MALTLKQSTTCDDIADVVYDYLPGSGDEKWSKHITFRSVANLAGVGGFWIGGSKKPAISLLLQNTLDQQPNKFEKLLISIVKNGITYKKKKKIPIIPQEIKTLNGLLLDLEFKFPDLWDPTFLASLDAPATQRAQEKLEEFETRQKTAVERESAEATKLDQLRTEFYDLSKQSDRQAAGYQFEKFLNELFNLNELQPRKSFKLTGEQIDGSFMLDDELYLVEAKWEKNPIGITDLYVFREKILGKSTFTRGVFISVNGITPEAKMELTHGKTPNFFIINGYHITLVLEGNTDLTSLLRSTLRKLLEEGEVYSPGP